MHAASSAPGPFLLELGALVAAMAVLARVAGVLAISPIPLYLLAGLALGDGGLLPLGFSESFVAAGADLGVVLLLFALGLEFSADELRESVRRSRAAGPVDLVLNAAPGLAVGAVLGWSWQACVLLGLVTYVSSSGVVAKLLEDLGRARGPETRVVMGILVVEDLAMAALLPVAAVLVAGQALGTAVATAAVALVVAAGAVLAALRFGRPLSRRLEHTSDEAVLLSIVGLLLLVSGLAEQAGVSAAVGAFLVGLAVADPVDQRARDLVRPLRDLFAAFFFVFFGLQVDPGALPPVLVAAVGVWLASAATKVATGYWVARREGIEGEDAVRAGAMLVARGEFSILVAELGAAAALEPQLGPLAAAYVLLCAVSAPLLARAAPRVPAALTGAWNATVTRRPPAPTPPGDHCRGGRGRRRRPSSSVRRRGRDRSPGG